MWELKKLQDDKSEKVGRNFMSHVWKISRNIRKLKRSLDNINEV